LSISSISLPSSLDTLAPPRSTNLIEKFNANCVALGFVKEKAGSGLFLNFSQVNHDCIGNVSLYYIPDQQLRMLVADCDILAGSKVSFSYASNVLSAGRAIILLGLPGFHYSCPACQNPDITYNLDNSLELDKKIFELGSQGKTEQAIGAGESLIRLHNKLNSSDMEYSRVYHDCFSDSNRKKEDSESRYKVHLEGAYTCTPILWVIGGRARKEIQALH
jgi:hypothetical protein